MKTKETLIRSNTYWQEMFKIELYNHIQDYMKEKGLNQTELAASLGVSKGYISQIMKGQTNFSISTLVKILLGIGRVPNFSFLSIKDYQAKQEQSESEEIIDLGDLDIEFSEVEESPEAIILGNAGYGSDSETFPLVGTTIPGNSGMSFKKENRKLELFTNQIEPAEVPSTDLYPSQPLVEKKKIGGPVSFR